MAVKAAQTITIFKSADISSLTLYFKTVDAGSSAPAKPTTATPTGWSTAEPSLDISKDLYATIKTLYTDNTFYYSDPQKYSSYEAAKTAYNLANAANTNANTALSKSVEKSDTAPSNTNKIWLDTINGQLKEYVEDGLGGGEWVIINDFTSLIGGLDIALSNLSDIVDTLPDKDYVDSIEQSVAQTVFNQTSEAFEMDFSTLRNFKTTAEGRLNDLETSNTTLNAYIRFENGVIILGQVDNEYTLKIDNDEITIYRGETAISHWKQTTFKVNTLEIGNDNNKFAFTPQNDGSLSFGKVRD